MHGSRGLAFESAAGEITMAKRLAGGVLRHPDNKLVRGLALGHFGAIVADPPWFFRTRTEFVSKRDPRHHYGGGVMSRDQIAALPVSDLAAKDSHLFLWATGPCLPQALEVMEAWGFRYSGIAFTWVKLRRALGKQPSLFVLPGHDFHVGLGFTTRKNCEFVLLGRRGNAKRKSKSIRELIVAPVREHSRKPDEIFPRIEAYCDGPYLELFSREERPGWTCRGDEVGKFGGGE